MQEDKDSSSTPEDDDDDVEVSMEEVPITVDEAIVSEVAAVEATPAAEPADSITAATKSTSGTAVVSDAPEEGVDAAEMAVEGAVEAPEGAILADIVDDVGLTQGGSSRSSDRVDSALLDSTPPSKFYVRRSRRVNIVSSDSERTPSVSAVHLTPRTSQSESARASPMHVIPTPPPVAMNAPLGAPSVENIRGMRRMLSFQVISLILVWKLLLRRLLLLASFLLLKCLKLSIWDLKWRSFLPLRLRMTSEI